VYGEDEFLAEENGQESGRMGEGYPSSPSDAPAAGLTSLTSGERARGLRSNRLVGLGLLTGVIVGVLGLVLTTVVRRPHAVHRSTVAQAIQGGASRSLAARRSRANPASPRAAAASPRTTPAVEPTIAMAIASPVGATTSVPPRMRPASHPIGCLPPCTQGRVQPTARPTSSATSVRSWLDSAASSLPEPEAQVEADDEFGFEQ
jgi:hypothetical protein